MHLRQHDEHDEHDEHEFFQKTVEFSHSLIRLFAGGERFVAERFTWQTDQIDRLCDALFKAQSVAGA